MLWLIKLGDKPPHWLLVPLQLAGQVDPKRTAGGMGWVESWGLKEPSKTKAFWFLFQRLWDFLDQIIPMTWCGSGHHSHLPLALMLCQESTCTPGRVEGWWAWAFIWDSKMGLGRIFKALVFAETFEALHKFSRRMCSRSILRCSLRNSFGFGVWPTPSFGSPFQLVLIPLALANPKKPFWLVVASHQKVAASNSF